ncbi:MAG: DNA repair exonuclease [Clostridia bacterium]|nr:DNA repair exonuclease [Clostridia bacterium]
MKILHMADCHLDSAMETHLPPAVAKTRRKELLLTFSNTVTAAFKEGVRLFLIAGDLFDTPNPTPATVRYVLDVCRAHESMDFIVIEGNHDRGALSEAVLPTNFHLVKAGEGQAFRYGDVAVFAAGYGADASVLSSFSIPNDTKNIMMLHGLLSAGGAGKEETLPIPLLSSLAVDYLALGHYHRQSAKRLSRRLVANYAGVPEGRGFDETGACGIVLLETETMKADFVPVAGRTLHDIVLDVSEMDGTHEIEEAVRAATEAIPEKDMVHLGLSGAVEESAHMDTQQILLYLKSKFFFSKLKNKTRLRIRAENYMHDLSLKGEFVRRVMASDLSETDKERVLHYGLRALAGEAPETT